MLFSPDEGYVLLGEVVEWAAGFGEVFDETSVEVGEPDESPQFFEVLRFGLADYGFDFRRVHGDLPVTYY